MLLQNSNNKITTMSVVVTSEYNLNEY